MAVSSYMEGRKKYARPQGMLWSDQPWVRDATTGAYVPPGDEFLNFIILTDDNRGEINFSQQRIEYRVRTVNGRMRSYWTADKLTLSTGWTRLPSRTADFPISFNSQTGKTIIPFGYNVYTTDQGAAGDMILDWYQNHQGPFWVYLSYDKFINFEDENGNLTFDSFTHLGEYSQEIEMYFSSFDYTVEKRGATNYDFWNINLSLEEV